MIIVGSTFTITATLGIDLTNVDACSFYMSGVITKANKIYTATVDDALAGRVSVEIPASTNDTVDTFKVWVEAEFPANVVRKTIAQKLPIVAEGTLA